MAERDRRPFPRPQDTDEATTLAFFGRALAAVAETVAAEPEGSARERHERKVGELAGWLAERRRKA